MKTKQEIHELIDNHSFSLIDLHYGLSVEERIEAIKKNYNKMIAVTGIEEFPDIVGMINKNLKTMLALVEINFEDIEQQFTTLVEFVNIGECPFTLMSLPHKRVPIIYDKFQEIVNAIRVKQSKENLTHNLKVLTKILIKNLENLLNNQL